MADADALARLRSGDLVFVRGRSPLDRIVALYGGVSHVAVVLHPRHGDTRVLAMTWDGASRRVPIGEYLEGWEYVHIIRPSPLRMSRPSIPFEDVLLTTDWRTAGRSQSNTYTFCAHHAQDLVATLGYNISFAWHPYSIMKIVKGRTVFRRGDRYDYVAVVMLIVVLLAAVLARSRRGAYEKGDELKKK
jgi:hypothetical protein